jgi:hypothetical protein
MRLKFKLLLFLLFVILKSIGQVSFVSGSISFREGENGVIQLTRTDASTNDEINFSITGGTAYGEGYKSLEGEVYGTGRDYIIRTGEINFKTGVLCLEIPIQIINDSIQENYETIQLSVTDQNGNNLSNKTITIVDNDAIDSSTGNLRIYNITDYGATPNDTNDDTQSIQNAIYSLYNAGGGILVFPPGEYLVTSVNLKDNITYEGYGAIIKRPNNQSKWTRTFNAEYEGSNDSKPLIIKGFEFDGNSANQGDFQCYQLEQAHLIFFEATATSKGKIFGFVEDCKFKNAVADGISVYTNSNITIYNCEATDVFRGGFTITGGNSIVRVYKFTTRSLQSHTWDWATGFDIEIDGKGYNDSYSVDVLMDGITLEDGDFDVGARGGIVIGNNIQAQKSKGYNFGGDGITIMKFTNCTVGLGAIDSFQRILRPGELTFENCNFVTSKHTSTILNYTDCTYNLASNIYSGLDLWWNHPDVSFNNVSNQKVLFKNCKFITDDSFNPADDLRAISIRYDHNLSNNNVLTVEGCFFSKGYDVGVDIQNGGNCVMNNVHNEANYAFFLSSPSTTSSKLTIDGLYINGENYGYINQNSPNIELSQNNVQLVQSQNNIVAPQGIGNIVYSGHRVIYGAQNPTVNQGFKGDVYRVVSGTNINEWRCEKSGFNDGININNNLGQWEQINRLQNLPSVAISLDVSSSSENPPLQLGKFTIKRTGSTLEPLAVNLNILNSGTATNGSDYYYLLPSIIIPQNSLSKSIDLMPVDDIIKEGIEVAKFSINSGVSDTGVSYLSNTQEAISILIQDNDKNLIIKPSICGVESSEKLSVSQDSVKLNGLDLYPNPAVDDYTILSLKLENSQTINVSIYDLAGKKLVDLREIKPNKNELRIDTNNLKSGIYLISIESEGEKIVKKLLVKK